MERGLVTLIGMSIAYIASFLGMGLAYLAWRRRRNAEAAGEEGADPARTEPHPGGSP